MVSRKFLRAAKLVRARGRDHEYSCNAVEFVGGFELRRLYVREMAPRTRRELSVVGVQAGAGIGRGELAYRENLDTIRDFRVLMLCMMAAAGEDLLTEEDTGL